MKKEKKIHLIKDHQIIFELRIALCKPMDAFKNAFTQNVSQVTCKKCLNAFKKEMAKYK